MAEKSKSGGEVKIVKSINEKQREADYGRFIDLMARMYLKYGASKIVTTQMVQTLFSKHQCGRK